MRTKFSPLLLIKAALASGICSHVSVSEPVPLAIRRRAERAWKKFVYRALEEAGHSTLDSNHYVKETLPMNAARAVAEGLLGSQRERVIDVENLAKELAKLPVFAAIASRAGKEHAATALWQQYTVEKLSPCIYAVRHAGEPLKPLDLHSASSPAHALSNAVRHAKRLAQRLNIEPPTREQITLHPHNPETLETAFE